MIALGGLGVCFHFYIGTDRLIRPFPVYGGLFEVETIDLLKRFYALGNKNAPAEKARKKKEVNGESEVNINHS